MTNLRNNHGTDAFLDSFFSGSLIGLPPLSSGANSLRPKFSDLIRTFSMEGKSDDYVIHQDTKLWANAYSRAGYRVMKDQGHILAGATSEFQLSPTFKSFFESAIPSAFKMEEFLVWLYAFRGIDDSISDWQALLTDFEEQYLGVGNSFDVAYTGRFIISSASPVSWPTDFLNARPSNEEFQKELMASSFTMPVTAEHFLDVRSALAGHIKANFQGYTDPEIERLSTEIVSSLTATKRVFLLGEPGIGKTKIARLIIQSFRDTFGDDRLFFADEPITDKTTPESLIGYGGITGEWVFGSLTSQEIGGFRLLNSEEELNQPNKRNQVNIVLLDECNRRNIEALLARLQNAMDSQVTDPRDVSQSVSLDASGKHFLSPNTFWILTGNSPLSDQGRVPQSRPFKRRPNLIVISNVVERLISQQTVDELAGTLIEFWTNHCQSGLSVDSTVLKAFADEINSNRDVVGDIQSLFGSLSIYRIGVSFGLIEKLFRTSSALMGMNMRFRESIDSGLAISLGPLLATDKLVNEKGLRNHLMEVNSGFETRYPRFWAVVYETLDAGSDFGIVRPFF